MCLPNVAAGHGSSLLASNPAQSGRITSVIQHRIEVRQRQVHGGALPVDGSASQSAEWVPAFDLRCNKVHHQMGSKAGHAEFTYLGLGGVTGEAERHRVESIFGNWHPDDQVRVIVDPLVGELGDGGTEGTPYVLFEGVMSRAPFRIVSQDDVTDEGVDFAAVASPSIDNQRNVITGRWVGLPLPQGQPGSAREYAVIESPSMPAVFNPGRPNMAVPGTRTHEVGGADASSPQRFLSRYFTHDDDPTAGWWTVSRAISAVLGQWLIGDLTDPLDRWVTLDPDLIDALNLYSLTDPGDDDFIDPKFANFYKRMPELDVTGMGVLDAVHAICEATGFQMAIEPAFPSASTIADRTYVLRIWQRGTGPINDVKLQREADFTGQAATDLANNDVSRITGLRDAHSMSNQVHLRGRTYIEASVELKPLWKRSEWLNDVIETWWQFPHDAGGGSNHYHTRHVAGGPNYEDYHHIGRMWGLDCAGVLQAEAYSATGPESSYHQPPEGTDWVDLLNLLATPSDLIDARTDLGITDPIVWSKRLRHALPLRSPDAQRIGINYVLEVSENSGGDWSTTDIEFRPLREWFGILITDARCGNLANVNLDALNSGGSIPVASSWWALMNPINPQLRFRLTCSIEADHATRYDVMQRATSGSLYTRAKYQAVDIEEVWQAPDCVLNDSGNWQRVVGWGVASADGDYVATIKDIGDQMIDRHDRVRFSVSIYTWAMRFARWQLGDRVWGIRGRDLAFSSDTTGDRAPMIVAMTFDLSGKGENGSVNQGLTLQLSDRYITEGAN